MITLRDLKNSQLTSMFFNTFINIEKYLDYEQRDPVALSRVRRERVRERERVCERERGRGRGRGREREREGEGRSPNMHIHCVKYKSMILNVDRVYDYSINFIISRMKQTVNNHHLIGKNMLVNSMKYWLLKNNMKMMSKHTLYNRSCKLNKPYMKFLIILLKLIDSLPLSSV